MRKKINMQRFKYKVVADADKSREVWVCDSCKKENAENILLGRWKLIDKRDDNDQPCPACGNGASTGATPHAVGSEIAG